MTPKPAMAVFLAMGLGAAVPMTAAVAATPDSWAKVDAASQTACLKAANLGDATVGPPVRYSDRLGLDARVVSGKWPQPHMKGAKAKMLCLYNRKNKRVEIQELTEPVAKEVVTVKDVWWRAEAIGGAGLVTGSEVTMMLGSDGKVGGRAGCNGYSASYRLEGEALKLAGPVISTRMACAPAIMAQEAVYLKLVENAVSVAAQGDGALMLASSDGGSIRFVRK